MNVSKRLENAVKALQENQLKKALYLTEHEKTSRQHEWVQGAARKCLANKNDKKVCEAAIKEAREKITDTITPPMEDTSLEGLEDYLSPESKPEVAKTEEVKQPELPSNEMTDEELYESCQECHVATAASRFATVCEDHPEETGEACKFISAKLADETTEPVDWIKAMIQTTEQVEEGEPKQRMTAALNELVEYLERRDSPFLKELKGGE